MTNFDYAIKRVLKNEGGLVDDPRDPGGITNHGISLRFIQKIGGNRNDIVNMTREQAKQIYKTHFWKTEWNTINTELAYRLLDMCVNMGSKQAVKLLQRALNVLYVEPLTIDGVYGNETHARVKNTRGTVLIQLLRSEAAEFYLDLNKPHYIVGWLNRLYDKH